MYHHQGSLFFIIILSTSNLTPFSAHASSESIFTPAFKFTLLRSAARGRFYLCFCLVKYTFCENILAQFTPFSAQASSELIPRSIFARALNLSFGGYHFVFSWCKNTKDFFRVSILSSSIVPTIKFISCNSQFSKKLPFRCGIHLLLLARLDYHLYLNFSTEKYSTMANFAWTINLRQANVRFFRGR